MNILSDTYIFYADVYFLQNFLIKVAVIYISLCSRNFHFVSSTGKGITKIMLAAAIGTVFEIIGLSLLNSYHLILVLVYLLEIPLIVYCVFRKEIREIWKVIVSAYFFLIMTNSILEILWNWFGKIGDYIFWLCISCMTVYIGICLFQNYHKMQKGIFPVEFVHNGIQVFTYGFYDSGNRLIDPYTQKGVHIVSNTILMRLKVDRKRGVYVPYQSLGNEQGMITVCYVECVRVHKKEHWIEEREVPIGIAEDTLFDGKKYEAILNERIW